MQSGDSMGINILKVVQAPLMDTRRLRTGVHMVTTLEECLCRLLFQADLRPRSIPISHINQDLINAFRTIHINIPICTLIL